MYIKLQMSAKTEWHIIGETKRYALAYQFTIS